MMRRHGLTILLWGVIILCLWPLVPAWWASSFAATHSCPISDSLPLECIVDGVDHGPELHRAFVGAKLLVVTAPVAFLALIFLILRFFWRLIRHRA